MARQRQGSRNIFTHARPSESSFQLELPGEAGLVPPPREAREPSAWIIAEPDAAPRGPVDVPPPRHPPRSVLSAAEAPAAAPVPPPGPVPAPAPSPADPPAEPLRHAPDTVRLDPPPPAAPLPPPPAAPAPPVAEQPPPTALPHSVPGETERHPAVAMVMPMGPTIDERILQEATSKAASILAEAERERLTLLEKARAEGAKQLDEARAERERILAQTRAEAEATLAEARQIHAAAHEQGHAEGFEAGQADARAAAYAQMEEKVGDLIAAIHQITQDALDDRHRRIDAMEPELVALALEIAEKIITQEVQSSPDVIAAIARDAIGRVRDRQEIVIHCSPADLETLQRYRDQFIRLEDLGNLRIVEDSRVGPGGVLIETAGGEIDARVEMQLERIRQEFQEVHDAHVAPPADRPE